MENKCKVSAIQCNIFMKVSVFIIMNFYRKEQRVRRIHATPK